MKQMKTCFLSALSVGILCAALILGTNVYSAEVDPCADDVAKFCQSVKPGADTIQCLESHERELTDACKDYEAKMHGRRGEIKERAQEQKMFRQDCGKDMALFCTNADQASGGLVDCLKQHKNELSPTCVGRLRVMESGTE